MRYRWILTSAVCFVHLQLWSLVGFACPIWTVHYATEKEKEREKEKGRDFSDILNHMK